jgi:hypothetical protein
MNPPHMSNRSNVLSNIFVYAQSAEALLHSHRMNDGWPCLDRGAIFAASVQPEDGGPAWIDDSALVLRSDHFELFVFRSQYSWGVLQ